jgi:hypothetical protein
MQKNLEEIYEGMSPAQFYADSGKQSSNLIHIKRALPHIHNLEILIEKIQGSQKNQLRYELRFIKEYVNDLINDLHV